MPKTCATRKTTRPIGVGIKMDYLLMIFIPLGLGILAWYSLREENN